MTKAKPIFDLDSNQSKIFEEKGDVTIIKPVEIDLTEGVIENINGLDYQTYLGKVVAHCLYNLNQQISIRQKCLNCKGSGYLNFYLLDKQPKCSVCCKGFIKRLATIQNVDVRRIQEIEVSGNIIFSHNIDLDEIPPKQYIRDWFNQKFGSPRSVYKAELRNIELRPENFVGAMHPENIIESYISYCYDEDSIKPTDDLIIAYSNEIKYWYKDKPLKIIVNPFVYLITIKKENK